MNNNKITTVVALIAETYLKCFCLLVLFLMIGDSLNAQTRSEGATPAMTQPGAPAGSYSLSGFESVNLFNGNLNFNLPLGKVGGRGSTQSPINLTIDSARWNVERDPIAQELVQTQVNNSYYRSQYHYNHTYNVCDITITNGHVTGIDCQNHVVQLLNLLSIEGATLNSPDTSAHNFYRAYEDTEIKTGYGPGLVIARGGRIGGTSEEYNSTQAARIFYTLTRLYFVAPDGTEVELRDTLTDSEPKQHGNFATVSRGNNFVSPDGSGIKFVSDNQINDFWASYGDVDQAVQYPTGWLYFPDGTKYRVVEGTIREIIDVNGNKSTYSYIGTTFVGSVDSMGRQTQIIYGTPANDPNDPDLVYDQIRVQKSSTEWLTTKVYRTKLEKALRGDQQLLNRQEMFPELEFQPYVDVETDYNPIVVKRVEMPDGRGYDLSYTSYKEIARVELPTGAAIEYDFPMPTDVNLPSFGGTLFRPVLERRMYANGGSKLTNSSYSSRQKYVRGSSITPDQNSGAKITVEEHSGNDVAGETPQVFKTDHHFYGAPNALQHKFFPQWKNGREYKTEVFDAAPSAYGNLRQRNETEWEKPETVAWGDTVVAKKVRVKSNTTTVFDGGLSLTSKNEYGYLYNPGSPVNLQTDEWMRDFGTNGTPGRILKHTQTGYMTVNPANSIDYASAAVYIHGLPVWNKLFDVKPNGAEELLSHTETKYDEADYPVLTYGGSPLGWTDPNTTARANPTTARVWNSDTNLWIETHAQFDQFGNPRKAWEPNEPASSTRFAETEYSPDYQYAFPTKLITPAPGDGIYGINQGSFATTTYDFYTGLTLTATNEFGQTTATEYNDVLLRPTRSYAVNFAAPEIRFEYGDTIGNLFSKVKKQIDANNWDEATTFMDGLGRAVKTQSKDSQGDVFVETRYDNMGRAKQTTNPYRQGNTVYWSKTRYDELGRAVEAFAPAIDGQMGSSLGVTSYSISTVPNFVGTVVTTMDASSRKGRSITNALGQLLRIDEPQNIGGTADADLGTLASPLQPTFYKYNAQGKMVEVVQGEQHRYFKYDSLGRLIRVRQPEQNFNDKIDLPDIYNTSGKWTAAFSYDVLGNVKRATDAGGTNIIYEYDKANRVTMRCYTKPDFQTSATQCSQISGGDVSANTPAVEYFYDGLGLDTAPPAVNNFAKGKLTKVASSVSETRYTKFDYLGRLLESEQRTPFGNSLPALTDAKVSKYIYNFSGALTEQEYPSGRKVKNEFEADGDLARVYGQVNANAAVRTYVNSFSFTASGGISQMRLGNGRWETAKFDERLQITEFGLGNSATDAGLWKLNYEYGELDANGTTITQSKNTGNIARMTTNFAGMA